MQLSSYVHPENHVKIGYNSLVAMKFEKRMPALNGSSSLVANYDNYQYKKKDKKLQTKSKSKKPGPKEKRIFELNKTKVRDKTLALFNLRQSKKFCAFITISFPAGFSDLMGVSVLNNVLTNVRQSSLKFNYLWVAERQKNKTIHFHMIVNRFFNVRILNGKFAQAIQRELVKTSDTTIEFNKSKYNGCDIKFIRSQANVLGYITKYIIKNKACFNIRAWACDSVVSRLFTHISELAGNLKIHAKILITDAFGFPKIYQNDWCLMLFTKYLMNNRYIKLLQSVNQNISDGILGTVKELIPKSCIQSKPMQQYLFNQQELSSMIY